jgi:hypothetical protein
MELENAPLIESEEQQGETSADPTGDAMIDRGIEQGPRSDSQQTQSAE